MSRMSSQIEKAFQKMGREREEMLMPFSASPLNNEAAQLHEKDPEEYQRKVLARHQDIDD